MDIDRDDPSGIGNSSPPSPEESLQLSTMKRTLFQRTEFGASIDFGHSPPEVILDIGRRYTASSPVADDVMKLREDIRQLRSQNRELQTEIDEDEEVSSSLRQKVNQLEENNLELISNFNQENGKLNSELAKLRSVVEQGEASRQMVEYKLTVARNEVSQEKRASLERQQELDSVIEASTGKIHDLESHVHDLESSLHKVKVTYETADNRYRKIIVEKEQMIATLTTNLDVMRTEKEQLDQVFQEQEGIYEEAQEKIEQLGIERNTQTETVRRQIKDIEYSAEREQRLKEQLEDAITKVKTLEENIESERAAHLESKFNSEIVRLRVCDFESAYDVEKSAHSEACKDIENLTEQLSKIQIGFDEEQTCAKEAKTKLNRLQQEHNRVKKQLTSELDEKKLVIGELSRQLDLHQKNFNELKQELKRAKKRQIYLEETYGGCMRELELLLNHFKLHGNNDTEKREKHKILKDDKPITPSTVLVTMKSTLMDYQTRLDETSSELSKMKTLYEKMATECEQYKEVTWSRSATVQDLQEKLIKTSKDAAKYRTEYQESESKLMSLKTELKKAAKMCQEERSQFTVLAEELHQRSKESMESEENKRLYLHSLYQRILAGRIVVEPGEAILSSFTWNELSIAVHDQVVSLMNSLKGEQEKMNDLETMSRQKDHSIQVIRQKHEQNLDRATNNGERRIQRSLEEKEEMERRYASMLEELQIKSRKTQGLADQAWEKVRLLSTVKDGLECECRQLREAADQSQVDNASLLAACTLLAGAYVPLCSRARQLALQRDILDQQLADRYEIKEQALELVQTLAMNEANMGTTQTKWKQNKSLLKFRYSVIAVMATNRLCRLVKSSQCLFTSLDTAAGLYSTIVCISEVNQKQGVRRSSDKTVDANSKTASTSTTHLWLTSRQTLVAILQATSDLRELLILTPEQTKSLDNKKAVQLAAVAFSRLVNSICPTLQTPEFFPNRKSRERGSLIHLLGLGLNRALNRSSFSQTNNSFTAKAIISILQKHILEFTQRLHSAELERRSLRIEVPKLRKESADLKTSKEKSNELSQQLDHLQKQHTNMIAKGKFESICHELSSALQREQMAQEILNEQTNQLEEMSMRLNVQTSDELERNATISEAVKGLSEAKMDLRRKDQSIRQLTRQLSQLESDKRSLQEGMIATENALTMNTKEKEAVTMYLKSIEVKVEELKRNIISRTDLKKVDTILNKMLSQQQKQILQVHQTSTDAKTLQNVIETFVATQQTSLSRMAALESEIESHKEHISTLKKELNAACRREYDEEEVMLNEGGFQDNKKNNAERSFGRLHPLFESEKSYMEDFVALREEPDYSMKYPASPDKSQALLSHPDNFRTPSSHKRSARKPGQPVRYKDGH